MASTKMLEAALQYAARGWHVFPVVAGKKTPRTENGFKDGTTDETAIRLTWGGKPFLNIGVAAGSVSGVWFLDLDGEPGAMSLMDLEQEHDELPETLTFRTPRGGRQHVFNVPEGVSIPSLIGMLPGIDTRGDGGYSVVPPSMRPEGAYSFLNDAPVADAPAWLVRLVTSAATSAPPMDTSAMTIEATSFKEHPGAGEGERNKQATRLAGCELARGSSPASILTDGMAWASRCRPPMQMDELRDVLSSIAGRESAKPESVAVDDDEAIEAIPLPSRQWPARPSLILAHGVLGDLLERIEEETEADPVAIATTFLVSLGNVIGREPHAIVDGSRHGLNLFATIIGGTSEGRKGTSMSIVRAIMKDIDQEWVKECRTPNLVSGEGLIDRVRDDVYSVRLDKKTGEPETYLAVPGVEDKRLLCEVQELASVMRAGRSDKSTLLQTIREAWDGHDLGTMAKNAKRTATDPHISIVAHVTPEELAKLQTEADVFGGTWNRFLWIAAKRARLRPHGGDFDDLRDLQDRVRAVVNHGRNVGRMRRTASADRLWEHEYYRRADNREGGAVINAILGRAEAQILRLSMLAAICRGEVMVDEVDLAAAVDLWRYVEETVRMQFSSGEDPLVAKIIAAVRESPGIGRADLHRLTAKTMSATQFVETLARAAATGAIVPTSIDTGGRPRESWSPRTLNRVAGEKGDKGDKSPPDPFSPLSPFSPSRPTEGRESETAQTATAPVPSSSKHGRTL